MSKVTLTFPDPNSLWLFKDQSAAVNVTVAPKKNSIAGLFSSEEVDMAIRRFQAVQVNNTLPNAEASASRSTVTKTAFRFRFSQLLSVLNL